jgi:PTS system ascorbate-specific IIB component
MKKKFTGFVVCGTGMGSSMILKVMVERVVMKNDLPIRLESDVVSAARSSNADFFIAGSDLVSTLQDIGRPVVGIRNMVDRDEILRGLEKVLEELPASDD